MFKYAKIINNETGLCNVGIGTNIEFYESIGMTELDVELSDIDGNWYLSEQCPRKSEEEKEQEEAELIGNLSMTRGDVFEALILSKGVTKATLRALIENHEGIPDLEKTLYLNRFDEALEFYRKHPAVNLIGSLLGISSEQMDRFFITKDWHELLNAEEE